MVRRGRKPLKSGHVERLDGSQSARQRLEIILQTLSGELTIPDACQSLGIGEARFHALRGQWMQASLELLEPRPKGRRAETPTAEQLEIARLEQEKLDLERQLKTIEAQREIDAVLTAAAGAEPAEKKNSGRRRRGRRVRQAR